MTLDKNLYIRRSRDDPSMVSVYYGAVLLAGALGTDGMPGNDQEAVNDWDYSSNTIPSGLVPDIDAINADPRSWLVPVPGEEMHFELYDNGVATGIIFKPFYETHHERYSVYWKLNAPAAARTWRGGGMDLIQDGTNWDVAPAEGDSIVFNGNLTTNVDNNYAAGSEFNDITFASTAASFNVGGNRITLQSNMSNMSSQVQTVQTDISLSSGSHTFHSLGSDMVVSGSIYGSGSINKTGNGRVILSGNNSYTGTTTVAAGELQIGDGGTSGSLGSGDVTLANNASIAFDRSDDIGLHISIQGDGNLIKRGAGTLTVNETQAYHGEARIEQGTLKLSDPLPIESEVFMLDFTSEVGTITDKDGQAIGFTRRLSGTDTTSDDPNLDLVTGGAGALYITSGGPSDINGETNLSSIEAPGINLSDLGLDQNDDFTIYATFEDAVAASNFRHYGVYVGDSAEQLIRGGYLAVNGHNIFGVNKSISSNNDSSLSMTTSGAPSVGENVDIILSRTGGVYVMTVNGVDVTPSSQLT